MRKQPPHSFTLYGNRWHVRFQDPMKVKGATSVKERKYLTARCLSLDGLAVATRSTGRRVIYIKPAHRADWTLFAHELLHALWLEKNEHGRVPGWGKEPLSHDQIHKMAEPLGQFLKENL